MSHQYEYSSSLKAESSQQSIPTIESNLSELSVSSTLSLVESTASGKCSGLTSTTFTSVVSTTSESIYTITSNESTFEMTTT
ncbi:Filamentous growth regulator 23 domain protein [Candida albicans]|uniref:Filamentous growth regulator 23 domain protein n=1 Tax=Candida albicans TaxID=5476 RepID=A0A8H6F5U0_CANAX|nr:Filamentous growth regulator 23 domain protein [Candida albicans]